MKLSARNWAIAFAVFMAMAVLTLLIWRQQVRNQYTLLEQRTEEVTIQASRRLEVFMESNLSVASIFATRWSGHETRDFSRKRFEEFSTVVLNHLPGYYAIGLIPPDLSEAWVVPRDVPILPVVLDPSRLDILEEARLTDDAVLSFPFESTQGATTVYALLPLRRGQEFLGYLVIDFNADALINDCFHTRIRSEYHFVVRDGDRVIFSSSPAYSANESGQARIRANVTLRVRNRTWNVEMVPTKEQADAYRSAVNPTLPLFGIFMSAGLSWLVFLLLRRIDMVRTARDQQILLARKVLIAHEEERARISRELHDELGQLLTALRLDMGWLEKCVSPEDKNKAATFENTVLLVEQATEELRRICTGLRPPLLDDLGLDPAVRSLVQEFESVSGIEVRFRMDLAEKIFVSKEVELCAYRILQEALTNIKRHANATLVTIQLVTTPGKLTLRVKDNGEGFDMSGLGDLQGWGLEGMRERANLAGGSLEIHSIRKHGTEIVFRVPLGDKKKEERNDSSTGGG